MARIKLKNLPLKLIKNKNLNMFTKHNNKPRSNQSKPRCNHPHIEIVPNVRCNHSPLAGESQSQLVGDAERGSIKNFTNSNAQLNSNNFTPSQNFLAENFTLPQGEGDEPVRLTSDFIKCRFEKKVPGSFFLGRLKRAC
jgi:hypothetical protein